MTCGVSFPSFVSDATFAMVTGAAHASFPVANLSDLEQIVRPFRASATGDIEFTCELADDQLVRFIALCRHNAPAGATYRFRLYSDVLTTEVHDSGTLTFGAPGLFAQTTPHLLSEAVAVRSVRVNLSSMGSAWQIGGLEVAGFWDLTDATARSLGLKARDSVKDIGDGAIQGTRQYSPRVISVGLDVVDWTEISATAHDFGWENGLDQPFVWVRDYDDTSTLARECVLVRNASLQGITKNAYIYGSVGLNMVEHP